MLRGRRRAQQAAPRSVSNRVRSARSPAIARVSCCEPLDMHGAASSLAARSKGNAVDWPEIQSNSASAAATRARERASRLFTEVRSARPPCPETIAVSNAVQRAQASSLDPPRASGSTPHAFPPLAKGGPGGVCKRCRSRAAPSRPPAATQFPARPIDATRQECSLIKQGLRLERPAQDLPVEPSSRLAARATHSHKHLMNHDRLGSRAGHSLITTFVSGRTSCLGWLPKDTKPW